MAEDLLVALRCFYGGKFEVVDGNITYSEGALTLKFGIWCRSYKYADVVAMGKTLMVDKPFEVWYSKFGTDFNNGGRRLRCEEDMPEFIDSKDKYDYIELYIVELKNSPALLSPGIGKMSGPRCRNPSLVAHDSSNISSSQVIDYSQQPLVQSQKTLLKSQRNAKKRTKVPPPRKDKDSLVADKTSSKGKAKEASKPTKKAPQKQKKVVQTIDSEYEVEGDEDWSETSDSEDDVPGDDFEIGDDFCGTVGTEKIINDVARSLDEGADGAEAEGTTGEKADVEGVEGDPKLWNVDDLEVAFENEREYASDELQSLDGSDDEVDRYATFNPDCDFSKKIDLQLGLKFPSNKVLRKALVHHAIENGYEFYYLHNGNNRITTYCRQRCDCSWNNKRAKLGQCVCEVTIQKCRFKVYAAKVKDEDTFQIKSLNLDHICGFRNQNKMVTSEFLAEKYLEVWRKDPHWTLESLKSRVLLDLNVDVGYHKCWLARARAKLLIFGNGNDQYARVWDYAAALRKYNPGSSAIVKVQNIERPPPLFQRMYVCLEACKHGFLQGCRPIIGVDGCHLKGPYPGMCLVAVSKDGNNNIFPVAWGVVEVENAATWTWFLELLINDLGKEEGGGLTFMSDRQKGLLDAFQVVTPKAEIRFCVRHIWANFKLQFSGQAFKDAFWKAAWATTQSDFNAEMEGVKFLSEQAYSYLKAIPPKHWSRHAFSTHSKSSLLLNNVCETFNAVLKDARDKPILTQMEWIRRYIMTRMCDKRKLVEKYEKKMMPYVDVCLKKMVDESKHCFRTASSLLIYEVDYKGDTFIVDLNKKCCSCFIWELNGIPCPHAVSCIMKQRHNPEDYVHEAYSKEKFLLAYEHSISPMPGVKQWEKTSNPQPLPPPFRKLPGRPSSKKRRKEPGEEQSKHVKRPKKSNKCGKCGGRGHNVKTCTNPAAAPKPKEKGGRPQKNTTWVKAANDRQARRKASLTYQAPSTLTPTGSQPSSQQQSQPLTQPQSQPLTQPQ